MPLVKGTSSVVDSRALNKALRQSKFPPHFSSRIQNWTSIKRPIIIQWIEKNITLLLGFEDEIVSSTAVNLFLPPAECGNSSIGTEIDPRTAQIDLAGFLGDDDAAKFASELWEMLLDASNQPTGIPRKILEEKKKELALQQEQERQIKQKLIEQQESARKAIQSQVVSANNSDSRDNHRDRRQRMREDFQTNEFPDYRRRSLEDSRYRNRDSQNNNRYDQFHAPRYERDYDSFGRSERLRDSGKQFDDPRRRVEENYMNYTDRQRYNHPRTNQQSSYPNESIHSQNREASSRSDEMRTSGHKGRRRSRSRSNERRNRRRHRSPSTSSDSSLRKR